MITKEGPLSLIPKEDVMATSSSARSLTTSQKNAEIRTMIDGNPSIVDTLRSQWADFLKKYSSKINFEVLPGTERSAKGIEKINTGQTIYE